MLLKAIMENEDPFGGKVFVGVGDFRQVAPVIKGNPSSTATLDASIRSSSLWQTFTILRLHAPIRNASDLEYSKWVDLIGEGKYNAELQLAQNTEGKESLGTEFKSTTQIDLPLIQPLYDLEEAIEFLFPDNILHDPKLTAGRSFLSPINVHVNDFNTEVLKRLNVSDNGKHYLKI